MVKEYDIGGLQNIEKYVSAFLKETNGERQLLKVTKVKKKLVFEFSNDKSKTASSFVKQFKKDLNVTFNSEQLYGIFKKGYNIVSIVDTKKVYLIFCSKP